LQLLQLLHGSHLSTYHSHDDVPKGTSTHTALHVSSAALLCVHIMGCVGTERESSLLSS
jgi:hypothetical protein